MADRNLEHTEQKVYGEKRRQAMLASMEQGALNWIIILPLRSLTNGLALMVLYGALHSINSRISAIGWWTSFGVGFAVALLMLVIEGWIKGMRKKDHV